MSTFLHEKSYFGARKAKDKDKTKVVGEKVAPLQGSMKAESKAFIPERRVHRADQPPQGLGSLREQVPFLNRSQWPTLFSYLEVPSICFWKGR